jgi:hypothetical protein
VLIEWNRRLESCEVASSSNDRDIGEAVLPAALKDKASTSLKQSPANYQPGGIDVPFDSNFSQLKDGELVERTVEYLPKSSIKSKFKEDLATSETDNTESLFSQKQPKVCPGSCRRNLKTLIRN